MKKQGKIVIAITHDDNYFDVADKIVKMENGECRMHTISIDEEIKVNL